MTGPLRLPVAAGLVVTGFVSGVAAVVLHGRWWGLVLALAAVTVLLVALPRGWWSRLPVALGWGAAVVLGAVPRSEGDYLVSADLAGYALLVASAVLLLAGLLGTSS